MLSTLATSLWLSSLGLDTLLVAVVLYKGRWKTFPSFAFLIVFDIIFNVGLYLIDSRGHGQLYQNAFNIASLFSLLVQLCVLVEIARAVLQQSDRWSVGALRSLWTFGTVGGLFAIVTTLIANSSRTFGWSVAIDDMQIFSSLAICEIVIAISLAANQLGLPIRSHVLSIGQGFAAWSLLIASIYGLESFVNVHGPVYRGLEIARALIYPLTVLYWTVSLWYEEPARKPISPAMRKYIVAIHDQVHYDLGKVSR